MLLKCYVKYDKNIYKYHVISSKCRNIRHLACVHTVEYILYIYIADKAKLNVSHACIRFISAHNVNTLVLILKLLFTLFFVIALVR